MFSQGYKKIILINVSDRYKQLSSYSPPRKPMGPHFPLGVASIASYLKEKLPQISLKILDDQILSSLDKIGAELKDNRPEVVGITCMFKNYSRALKLARCAKRVGAKVLIGGNYAAALAKEVLVNRGPRSNDYCVDGVVKQDGERAFYEYVAGKPLRDINNLVYCEKEKIIENPISLMNLNDLPPLNFEYLNPHDYFKEYQRRFPASKYKRPFDIYSQKGCRWRDKPGGGCLFCSIMYGKLRLRSPKIIWDEIERLVSDYGVDYIWDVADNFTGNKDWLKKFYQESLRRKFQKPFLKIQARVDDLIDENIVKMLHYLNVVQLFIGFESDDNQRLAVMKKGTTSSMNRKAVANLMKYNLPIRTYLVFGSAGETHESLAKSVKLAEDIFVAQKNNLVAPHIFTPLPGSTAFQMFLKKTGKKYAGQDDINWNDAIFDWVKNFSKVSFKDLKEAERYLRKIRYDISAYSF